MINATLLPGPVRSCSFSAATHVAAALFFRQLVTMFLSVILAAAVNLYGSAPDLESADFVYYFQFQVYRRLKLF